MISGEADFMKESDWNSAQLCAFRLHEEFVKCNDYSSIQDYFNWMQAATNVYKEVWSKLKPKEKEEIRDMREKIRYAHNVIVRIQRKTKRRTTTMQLESDILRLLEEFELMLRDLADDHGMLMPNKEDPGMAVYH